MPRADLASPSLLLPNAHQLIFERCRAHGLAAIRTVESPRKRLNEEPADGEKCAGEARGEHPPKDAVNRITIPAFDDREGQLP